MTGKSKGKSQKEKISARDLAGLISEKLREKGIDATLVGGACVTIYSKNKYVSADLDFVTDEPVKNIERVMTEIGFDRISGKYFEKKGCPFTVEFLNAPVAIGKQVPVREFSILRTKSGNLKVLTPGDSVKDRLAAYYYWNDLQSLDQAVMITKRNKINMKEIERWSIKEGQEKKYREFEKKLGPAADRRRAGSCR